LLLLAVVVDRQTMLYEQVVVAELVDIGLP
jgi:hypothetical protein